MGISSSTGSNKSPVDLVGPGFPGRLVTVIVGIVVGLTFLFGFGNALGLRLGVPIWGAPLVALRRRSCPWSPCFSAAGISPYVTGPWRWCARRGRLLIFGQHGDAGAEHRGTPDRRRLRPGRVRRAGPLLLIGGAEVGPSLLQAMRTGETTPSRSEGSLEPYAAERSAPHGFR